MGEFTVKCAISNAFVGGGKDYHEPVGVVLIQQDIEPDYREWEAKWHIISPIFWGDYSGFGTLEDNSEINSYYDKINPLNETYFRGRPYFKTNQDSRGDDFIDKIWYHDVYHGVKNINSYYNKEEGVVIEDNKHSISYLMFTKWSFDIINNNRFVRDHFNKVIRIWHKTFKNHKDLPRDHPDYFDTMYSDAQCNPMYRNNFFLFTKDDRNLFSNDFSKPCWAQNYFLVWLELWDIFIKSNKNYYDFMRNDRVLQLKESIIGLYSLKEYIDNTGQLIKPLNTTMQRQGYLTEILKINKKLANKAWELRSRYE